MEAFAGQLTEEARLEESPGGRIRLKRLTRLGRLTLRERIDESPDPALVAQALVGQVRERGLGAVPFGSGAGGLRQRIGFLRGLDPAWPDLSDAALLGRLDEWLEPLLPGARSLTALSADALEGALRALVPWELQRRLDALAPTHFVAPTGSRLRIDYAAEGGPRVDVRVQEVFGLAEHPAIADGKVPLTLALLSPAHRPIQLTKDLPGFWRGSWKEVRAEMRGRYPKHVWPEDPASASPTTRAKPRA